MKKKIIFAVIGVILIFLIGYAYSVVNGKGVCGTGGGLRTGTSSTGVVIGDEAKFRIVNIKLDSLSGDDVIDSNGKCVIPATFEEMKNCSGFKISDAIGKLKVEVLDINYEVVESYTVNSNEKSSKYVKLSNGKQYTVQVSSDGFNGQYKVSADIYNLF